MSVTLQYLPLVSGGYSVIRHSIDEKGHLEGVTSVGLLGVLLDEDGDVRAVQTVQGREPVGAPIVGPDGEVTLDGALFPSIPDYVDWFLARLQ